jgi:predicted outer membrane repeat protein
MRGLLSMMLFSSNNRPDNVIDACAALALIALALFLTTGCSDTAGPSEPEVFATYVIDPSGAGDFVTIQEGLNAAASGDTVLLVPGTYTGPGNMDLVFNGTSPVVMGMGEREETVIDCAGGGRGFYVGGSVAPLIENLTVMNGYKPRGAGMYLEGTSPTIRNVRFRYNRAGEEGGGLYCRGGSPALHDVLFDDNTAYIGGGGMQCVHCPAPALSDVTFNNNAAQGSGGGLSCIFSDPALSGCVFWRNSSIFGAAIYCADSSPAITSCTLAQNEAEEGAGVYTADQSSPSITSSIIAFSTFGKPMDCGSGSSPFTTRCCIFENAGGDTLCGTYSTSMLYVDPLFCDLDAGDLTLRADSPCLPGNNTWSVLIGALGVGCDTPN